MGGDAISQRDHYDHLLRAALGAALLAASSAFVSVPTSDGRRPITVSTTPLVMAASWLLTKWTSGDKDKPQYWWGFEEGSGWRGLTFGLHVSLNGDIR